MLEKIRSVPDYDLMSLEKSKGIKSDGRNSLYDYVPFPDELYFLKTGIISMNEAHIIYYWDGDRVFEYNTLVREKSFFVGRGSIDSTGRAKFELDIGVYRAKNICDLELIAEHVSGEILEVYRWDNSQCGSVKEAILLKARKGGSLTVDEFAQWQLATRGAISSERQRPSGF